MDPAVDPADAEQQQVIDQATLETMKQESQAAAAADESATAEMEEGTGEMAEASVDMGMVDMPTVMDTSSADNQMAFESDQQSSAEPFVAEETGPSDIA